MPAALAYKRKTTKKGGRRRGGSPLFRALVHIAHDLADCYRHLTVEDVRDVALRRGILTGKETREELSVLGGVMRAADLAPTGTYKRSEYARSHGNLLVVWASRSPYADAVRAA